IVHKLIWVPYKIPVNRADCSCSCFDTIFRGTYENQDKISYKHIYFNVTAQSLAVWIWTVFFILLTYETLKYIYYLTIPRWHIRYEMLLLMILNIYPHYYSWWSLFNYINMDFYLYFFHHSYFIVTEFVVSAFVLNMCNSNNPITFQKIFFIFCINSIHILLSGIDQFVVHVLFGTGKGFQNARDIGLMIPDLAHLVVACWSFLKLYRSENLPLSEYKFGFVLAIIIIFIGTSFGNMF
ncbi:uncharacterized protein LOC115222212, partial [Argonauta hians]